jgi:uncharacterized metal-binding protein YceD (DUF177 family)
MNTLKVPVTSIGETGYAFEALAPLEEIQPSCTESLPVREVKITGMFTPVGQSYLFRGAIKGIFSEACWRCLEPVQKEICFSVVWVFEEGPFHNYEELGHPADEENNLGDYENSDAESKRSFQGLEIDLAPYIWEELVLALPSSFVCDIACRGLCPHCGVNLNLESCRCSDTATSMPSGNNSLAALARLFPDLAPSKNKE